MDPNLKLILDEFKVVRGSVSYLQTSLTLQIETVETNIGKRFGDLENSSKVLNDWKPRMDATVDDLRLELGALRKDSESRSDQFRCSHIGGHPQHTQGGCGIFTRRPPVTRPSAQADTAVNYATGSLGFTLNSLSRVRLFLLFLFFSVPRRSL
ncbi:unnamed protein product [Miscanthus lutarioriparius]|uniref:Uncharacterized protein n=1 Tax=Miscanthus lutarioriparius TaxID=422564 RepID=A0A811N3M4_9POAL|nr:unnamed protein product [Miscanthus lutarioriparius]CAD6217752.1 unnamed protein product [Miscanthus lutarioriparius]